MSRKKRQETPEWKWEQALIETRKLGVQVQSITAAAQALWPGVDVQGRVVKDL